MYTDLTSIVHTTQKPLMMTRGAVEIYISGKELSIGKFTLLNHDLFLRFDNVIRTEVTTILMPSWATRVAIEKARVRHLSPRGHLDGIVVNPFASSCLVDGTQVSSLVVHQSTSFMLIAPCTDHRIRFHGAIELEYVVKFSVSIKN